jgi:protein-disulfide isomerase
MAGMKRFYYGFAALAVGGAGILLVAMGRGGATLPSGPINVDAIERARAWPGYEMGDPDAPVEIIEYADFECPGCRTQWVLTIPYVKERLVATGLVRFAFRDFPLSMHKNSRPAHHAAACAAEQGKFQQMHDKLFETQPEWTGRSGAESQFRQYAKEIGLDLEQYDACTAEGRYRARIQASLEGGVDLGVASTPTFVIGNHLYSQGVSYDGIKQLVDSIAATVAQ